MPTEPYSKRKAAVSFKSWGGRSEKQKTDAATAGIGVCWSCKNQLWGRTAQAERPHSDPSEYLSPATAAGDRAEDHGAEATDQRPPQFLKMRRHRHALLPMLSHRNGPRGLRYCPPLFAIPLIPLQINMIAVFERNALPLQQTGLLPPAGNQPPRMVDHTVAGIFAVPGGVAEDLAHKPCVSLPANQPGNLAVGGDPALRNLLHNRQDFIDQPIV